MVDAEWRLLLRKAGLTSAWKFPIELKIFCVSIRVKISQDNKEMESTWLRTQSGSYGADI
jgi:hypothetical protein